MPHLTLIPRPLQPRRRPVFNFQTNLLEKRNAQKEVRAWALFLHPSHPPCSPDNPLTSLELLLV